MSLASRVEEKIADLKFNIKLESAILDFLEPDRRRYQEWRSDTEVSPFMRENRQWEISREKVRRMTQELRDIEVLYKMLNDDLWKRT